MENKETRKFGRYEIVSEIGRGGMASVFHAYDPRFERDVAIKILPLSLQHDPQFRARFDREAKTIGLLEHPTIVPVYDVGEEDGQPYIVMRLMTGGSLSERLENGPLSLEEAEAIISRIAQALDVAHAKGIIHRDIKPGNIMFDQYSNAFLSDFGIARMASSGSTLTGSQIIGTPAYMSPEQIQGDKEIDGRSDVYALGIILFHALTKDMPFKADTPAKLMMAHVLNPIPNITDFNNTLPLGMNAIIQRAMEKDVDNRYRTAGEMGRDLRLLVGRDTGEYTPQPSGEATLRPMTEGQATMQSGKAQSTATVAGKAPDLVVEQPAAGGRNWLVIGGIGVIVALAAVAGVVAIVAGGGIQPTAEANLPATSTIAPATDTPLPSATLHPTETEAIIAPIFTDTPTVATEIPTATATAGAPHIGGADMIAFVADKDIWIANLDGTNLTQLTADKAHKFNLVWTPDGQEVAFISGKCINSVSLAGIQNTITCLETAELLEGFDFSPDGTQMAISVDRELYIFTYDLGALRQARFRSHLQALATCDHFAPYDRGSAVIVKEVQFSRDGLRVGILRVIPGATGLLEDVIQIVDISACVEKPDNLITIPGGGAQFTMPGYTTNPIIPSWDWDGDFLFTINNLVRNDRYGDLFSYNMDRLAGTQINPIQGHCCYVDARWSPDGRFLLFAFQDIALGANSTTVFYYVSFSSIGAGGQPVPMNIPALTDPRESPYPALRPVPVSP